MIDSKEETAEVFAVVATKRVLYIGVSGDKVDEAPI